MALSKPVLKSIPNFDATDYQVINFTTNEPPVWLEYVIENNETGVEAAKGDMMVAVQSGNLPMYQLSFVLANDILTNGVKYRMKIRIGNFYKSEWSAYSNYKTFTCSSAPIITIDNLLDTSTITEQNVLLTGTYQQGEDDELAFYQFIVYNNDGSIFAEQPVVYGQHISYYLTGLVSGYKYKIELKCTSQKGIEVSTGQIEVDVVYFKPNMNSLLELYNTDDGMVQLEAILSQVRGEINEYVSYYPTNEPDWLDITDERGVLSIKEGLNSVSGDYTIIFWAKNIASAKELLKIHANNGTITVKYENGLFKAFVNMNSVNTLYLSDEVLLTAGARIKIAMIVSDGRIGFKVLECEKS